MEFYNYTNLTSKDLYNLNLHVLQDYNISLPFEDSSCRLDYYSVYIIKQDNLIISYAIL